MKTLKYLLFIIGLFVITNPVYATTNLELVGKNKVNAGSTIEYNVILKTDENVYGFQFDLSADPNLEYLSYQSNIEGLIVKASDNKTRIIGYGKELTNGDNLLTIVFNVKRLDKTTNTATKLVNSTFVNPNNATIASDIDAVKTTKVVVPVTESNSTSVTKTSVKKDTNTEIKITPEEKDEEKEVKKENNTSKIVKIVLIVLIGGLILYLLNKEDGMELAPEEKSNQKDNKGKKTR